jgi:hypothetical protein
LKKKVYDRVIEEQTQQFDSMTRPEQQAIATPPRAPSPVHRFGTLAVHAGSPHDPVTGAVIEPVRSHEANKECSHDAIANLK